MSLAVVGWIIYLRVGSDLRSALDRELRLRASRTSAYESSPATVQPAAARANA